MRGAMQGVPALLKLFNEYSIQTLIAMESRPKAVSKGLKSALLTMVERKTLYTVIMRLTGKQSGL
ncbi:MAG: hypothetical protein KZQ66_01965, partial [Candidatus Thiodiazotropha sp. (ex Lucinoma aequizonata)]|nr:hypothetical protein [Candidatus Thiodiazotropha sp. (ex Lucinoma aequizonata)]MCU7897458.1 hypothetical protein [Candidatus Thiodiazotropha sp. (ex Lucinoma aequizonata)]MCU7900926.1 hypothetical protein [Candidatus Thiodiazotropha sp. (ex Lucinoma aequizonata)]